jgi:hypothetical protein
MLRLCLLVVISGCGTLLRAEAGPTWIEGTGAGATLQATIGGSPIAGAGIYEMVMVGGFGTWFPGGLRGGLLVGVELGVAPGGLGSGDRGGLGGAVRFAPRLGTEVELGAGVAATWGEGQQIDSGGFSLADHEKGGIGFDWDVRRWWTARLAVDVQRALIDERAGPWRVDTLLGVERLVLAD